MFFQTLFRTMFLVQKMAEPYMKKKEDDQENRLSARSKAGSMMDIDHRGSIE